MSRQPAPETEIYVRLSEDTMDFVYSIRRGDEVIESGLVSPIDKVKTPPIPGYRHPEVHQNPGSDLDLELWSNPDAARAFHSFLYGRAE